MHNKLLKEGEIGIFALGGLGEVGKNTYVFEIDDKIFLVDAGILFPDESLLGIDYVIPDYSYLVANQTKIVGLFITHGHEDHIGGIPFLLRKVLIPKIYASGIAVDLIEYKLAEHPNISMPKIEEYKSHYTYTFDDVELSFIRLNHSIPDMFGLVFKTKQGTIFHTGDFKIDYTPVGLPAEYDKIAAIGSKGVLCLLSDSTNAEQEGLIQSESKVGRSINELFTRIPGRVIIATFASNLYRIQQIIEAAELTKRKVAVFGRSMERALEAGMHSGYVRMDKDTLIKADELANYPQSETCLICTGSQGEPLAALSRVASNNHRHIKATKGDTVIFSSSPIPGNQESINKTINALFKMEVNVITHGPLADTHTSGHGSQNDLKLMLSLTKPKFFIPVHGEHRMLKHHAKLAIECGVKKENCLIMDNGDVAALTKDSLRIAGHVPASDVYIDGLGIGDIGSKVLSERKILSEEGLISIIVTVDINAKKIINNPSIVSRGFIYMKGNEAITSGFASYSKEVVEEQLAQKAPSILSINNALINKLGEKILEMTLRKPMVIPIIIDIDSKGQEIPVIDEQNQAVA